MRTHYDNLHVSEKASPEVIKGAYKALSQKWHPDKHPDQREKAERYFKIISRAFELLSDPKARAEYDAWLAAQRSTSEPIPEAEQVDEPVPRQSQRVTTQAQVYQEGSADIQPAAVTSSSWIARLWRGEEGLGMTFWLYGIVGMMLVSIASFILAIAIAEDRGDTASIIRTSQNIYIPYFIFISICVFRAFRRALNTPGDAPHASPHESLRSEPEQSLLKRLLTGKIQARYVIAFGIVAPTITLPILFRLAFEPPNYEEMVMRIYTLCAPILLSCAYIMWSSNKHEVGRRKSAILGCTAVFTAIVLLIAYTF